MKRRHLFLLLALLGIPPLLAGCRTISGIVQANLVGLDGKPLIDPQQGNCVFDQLDAREEGYRLAGSVGGLAFVSDGRPTPIARAAAEAARIAAIPGLTKASRATALLIVDDFAGGRVLQLGAPVFELAGDALRGAPEGFEAAFDATLDTLEANGELSHGALVMQHAVALVAALPGAFYEGAKGADTALFRLNDAPLVLRAVDTGGFRTDRIADAIRSAAAQLLEDFGVLRFSVNMSFAIVPCSVVGDFRRSGIPSFDAYVDELARRGYLGLRDELFGIAVTPLPGDPLEAFVEDPDLKGPGDETAIVFHAASGNYALPYQLAPATWSGVLGVGAGDADSDLAAGFTNAGQVLAGGAWYRLEDPVGFTPAGPVLADDLVLAGTSFAAPAAALFGALDLAQPTPRCYDPGRRRSRLLDLSPTDRPLAAAVADRCAPAP